MRESGGEGTGRSQGQGSGEFMEIFPFPRSRTRYPSFAYFRPLHRPRFVGNSTNRYSSRIVPWRISIVHAFSRSRIYIYPFSNESKFPRNGQNLNELNSLLARLLPSSLIDPNDARVSSSDRPYETVSSGIRIRLIAFQEYARGYATVCYPTRTRARTHTHERAYT